MKQLSVILLFVLTAGCSSASTPDPAADRQAIAAVTAAFQAAENAGDVEQMLLLFADDLVIMSPNSPALSGTAEIAAAMRAFHEAFTVQVEYSSQEIAAFGDWGFDRGTEHFTLTPKNGGAPISANGKYLWLYRRQPDGSWKQSRVMWNSDDPPRTGGV